jgi:hypothetical protein
MKDASVGGKDGDWALSHQPGLLSGRC